MATTYTADVAAANNAYKGSPGGGVFARVYDVPVTAAQVGTINNVIQAVPVYKGETVLGVEIKATDLDTNVSPALTLSVGDDGATARYIAASDIGQAGGSAKHTVGVPHTYTADNTIDVLVAAASATGAAGTISIVVLLQSD